MNKDNLLKLADHLDTVEPDRFDMNLFFGGAATQKKRERYVKTGAMPCGTVACALGYGPSAGLTMLAEESRAGVYRWFRYSARVFGVVQETREWNFLFHCHWAMLDNTPAGAAKRIRYMLEHGVPANHNYNPECYA